MLEEELDDERYSDLLAEEEEEFFRADLTTRMRMRPCVGACGVSYGHSYYRCWRHYEPDMNDYFNQPADDFMDVHSEPQEVIDDNLEEARPLKRRRIYGPV